MKLLVILLINVVIYQTICKAIIVNLEHISYPMIWIVSSWAKWNHEFQCKHILHQRKTIKMLLLTSEKRIYHYRLCTNSITNHNHSNNNYHSASLNLDHKTKIFYVINLRYHIKIWAIPNNPGKQNCSIIKEQE